MISNIVKSMEDQLHHNFEKVLIQTNRAENSFLQEERLN
jgi:hypothetical protein